MDSLEEKERTMPAKEPENWARFTPEYIEELIRVRGEPAIGYLLWSRASHGVARVHEYIDALTARRIRHVRTGVLRYAAKEGLLPLVEKALLKRKLPE